MTDAGLAGAVERGLADRGLEEISVVSSQAVGGGCIHEARLLELEDGGRLFVKSNRTDGAAEMFEAERRGLEALAAVDVLRVPRDPWLGSTGELSFLVMEAIREGRRGPDFFPRFGEGFARFHREGRGERFGFESDNFLGSTPQPNDWSSDWVEFWRRRRIGHQLVLARETGRSDRELERLGDRLLGRLDEWIDLPEEPPCLLHGDLWGGNYLVDESGEPVLVDPAVYYGHREADLAMTRLFGGFEPSFYEGYEESWPLPAGAEDRLPLYELYHLLNHLNLFGAAYRGRCLAILSRYVG